MSVSLLALLGLPYNTYTHSWHQFPSYKHVWIFQIVVMKPAAQKQNIPLQPSLSNGEVEGLRSKTCSLDRGILVPVLHRVSCSPMLTLETSPGGKQRGSCWTRRATLPPFCLVSQWRSWRCWGCHRANLESDWKIVKFSKTTGCVTEWSPEVTEK